MSNTALRCVWFDAHSGSLPRPAALAVVHLLPRAVHINQHSPAVAGCATATSLARYHCALGGTSVCCSPWLVDLSLRVARTATPTLLTLTSKHATQRTQIHSGAAAALGPPVATLHCQVPSPIVATSYPAAHSHSGCLLLIEASAAAPGLAPGPATQ